VILQTDIKFPPACVPQKRINEFCALEKHVNMSSRKYFSPDEKLRFLDTKNRNLLKP
jgi:hypothetical protein